MDTEWNIEWYKDVIRDNLYHIHAVPKIDVDRLLDKYHGEVTALFDGGIAATSLIYWFYLEWVTTK